MEIITSVFGVFATVVTVLGAVVATQGIISYAEGYGSDNPGAKTQGIKQLAAGGGIILVGILLIPTIPAMFG